MPSAFSRLVRKAAMPVQGDEGDNELNDTLGDDIINGAGGNDTISHKGGHDTVDGGAGDDHLIIDYSDAGWQVRARPTEISERDTRSVGLVNVERISLTTGSFGDDIHLRGHSGDNFIDAGDGDDSVRLGGGANRALGGLGADFLEGVGGNDVLEGGDGSDSLFGDSSHRIEATDVQQSAGAVSFRLPFLGTLSSFVVSVMPTGVQAGEEIELVINGTVMGPLRPGPFGPGESQSFIIPHEAIGPIDGGYTVTLRHVGGGDGNFGIAYAEGEYVTYSDDKLFGGADFDNLTGGHGDDLLDGGAGGDVMYGGEGNDVFIVDTLDDVIVESELGGFDEIRTSLSNYQLDRFPYVEKLTATGTIGQTLIGNDGANTLTGTIGDDILDGGAGSDIMSGGAGNDIYYVDRLNDKIGELAGEGIDEVRTSVGSRTDFNQLYHLPSNIENLVGTATGGQGVYLNALDNNVTMGDGNDLIVLDNGGIDTVNAGGGDDFIYYGGALTAEDRNNGGAGSDGIGLLGGSELTFAADTMRNIEKLAVYSSGDASAPNSYRLAIHDANVAAGQNLMVVGLSLQAAETLVLDGSAETDGTLNIRGGRGSDTLTGGAGRDQLYGNLGSDMLKGGLGRDSFEYYDVLESTPTARDTIGDFAAGDKINLINIDSDGATRDGNGRFAWIGNSAFSGKAGELRAVQVEAGKWLVQGDVDGNGAADLEIMVETALSYTLSAADFWL